MAQEGTELQREPETYYLGANPSPIPPPSSPETQASGLRRLESNLNSPKRCSTNSYASQPRGSWPSSDPEQNQGIVEGFIRGAEQFIAKDYVEVKSTKKRFDRICLACDSARTKLQQEQQKKKVPEKKIAEVRNH